MIRLLSIFTLMTLLLPAQEKMTLAEALDAGQGNDEAKKVILDALRSQRGSEVVRELAIGGRFGKWFDRTRGPTQDPISKRLIEEPSYLRLVAGRLESRETRYAACTFAAGVVRWTRWPYLSQIALERLCVEDANFWIAPLLKAMRGVLKDAEIAAVWRSRGDPDMFPSVHKLRRAALYRLALLRAAGSERVAAWPGGDDWTERGFSPSRTEQPLRALSGPRVRIPLPLNRDADQFLLVYDLTGVDELPRFRVKGESFRDIEVTGISRPREEGQEPPGLPKYEWKKDRWYLGLPAYVGKDSREIELVFETDQWKRFRFHGLVGFEKSLTTAPIPWHTIRLPGDGVEVEGAKPDGEYREGLLVDGDEVTIRFDAPDRKDRPIGFEIDNWSEDKGFSAWEARLNGTVLMQFISQPKPRAAKGAFRRLNLKRGRNELVLKRLKGKTTHLEAIRLRYR